MVSQCLYEFGKYNGHPFRGGRECEGKGLNLPCCRLSVSLPGRLLSNCLVGSPEPGPHTNSAHLKSPKIFAKEIIGITSRKYASKSPRMRSPTSVALLASRRPNPLLKPPVLEKSTTTTLLARIGARDPLKLRAPLGLAQARLGRFGPAHSNEASTTGKQVAAHHPIRKTTHRPRQAGLGAAAGNR